MIDRKDVEHVARLARLALTEAELERMRGELAAILQYIEKLKAVDVDGVEPTSHAVPLVNVMREDDVEPVLRPRGDDGQRPRPVRRVLPGAADHRGLSSVAGDLTRLTAHELTDAYRRGEATPTKAVEAYLARIERLDGDLGAYLTVTRDAALAAARAAEARYRAHAAARAPGRRTHRPEGRALHRSG